MSKVTRNNRKSRSSVRGRLFAIVDKSNRLYQANPIPARNLSLLLLFLITNQSSCIYIYIYKPSNAGSFVTGAFRFRARSNRVIARFDPLLRFRKRETFPAPVRPCFLGDQPRPDSGESREEKGFIRTIYTGKIAYHRGRKKSCQVHRGLETQRSHCLGRWFVSGEWKEVDSSANLCASISFQSILHNVLQTSSTFFNFFF